MRERVPILRVEVWYDGSKRTVQTIEEWRDLPDGIVLAQVLYDFSRKGKYLQDVLAGYDWYWWHGDKIDCTRATDVPATCRASEIKSGALVSDSGFLRAYNEACEGVSAAE
jgi:hypothetical protein